MDRNSAMADETGASQVDGSMLLMQRLKRIKREESGFALIETMVSAMLLIIVAVGVFTAFDSGTRATAEERHRAQAHGLADDDQARIRSLPTQCPTSSQSCTTAVESLLTPQSRVVTLDGTQYTIVSRAQFATENTSTNPCTAGVGSRDYLQISSTVTWPSKGNRPAVVASGLVPIPRRGTLLVNVVDRDNDPVSGVGVSGTGPASFSGTTGQAGCVRWTNLRPSPPNYAMTVSGGGRVDQDGNPPPGNAPTPTQTVSVGADSSTTLDLLLDFPGSIQPITFRTRNYSNTLVNTSTDAVTVFNTGMSSAKSFGTPGSPATSLSASGLFPFTSPYAVYAGLCAQNNPGTGVGLASVTVNPGQAVAPSAPLQIPALQLTVRDGSSSTSPGAAEPSAVVRVEDTGCPDTPTTGFKRSIGPTNSSGQLPNPGLPYGSYQVCADSNIVYLGNTYHVFNYVRSGSSIENVPVQNLSAGTPRTIYLTGTGVQLGTCPT
jgi:type II secretory pathway pseudopilin PulG